MWLLGCKTEIDGDNATFGEVDDDQGENIACCN